ncbi:MAG TPA: DUF4330 domain-containing protein [Firmicutes bacterium]|nr:DUF4330 domain-containing protein [Bacillota bacterium]
MRLIDDKGRLFGLVNIVDLAVVLLVVAVAARIGLKSRLLRAVNPSTLKPVEVVLLIEDVRPATADAVSEGDTIVNAKSNAVLGELIAKEVVPALKEVETADGRLVEAEAPYRKDVYITVRGQGQVTENVIILGGYEMRVGANAQVKGLKFAVNSTVFSVKVDE